MPCARSSLLSHLRRHRGLWVLAVAVLLIKLVSGSIGVADGPRAQFVLATAAAQATLLADTAVSTVSADEVNTCRLGEGGGCHRDCAHSVTLPATAPMSLDRLKPRSAPLHTPSGFPDPKPDLLGKSGRGRTDS